MTPSASLIKTDTTTEGNWIGTYGSQGYDIIENAVSLPSYATVTPSGQSSSTGWPSSTTAPRALQTANGSSRIAACWYSATSFTVDVNLTDDQMHDLALYFLDWDKRVGASRCSSPTPPRGRCSIPKRFRRSNPASTCSGPSTAMS